MTNVPEQRALEKAGFVREGCCAARSSALGSITTWSGTRGYGPILTALRVAESTRGRR